MALLKNSVAKVSMGGWKWAPPGQRSGRCPISPIMPHQREREFHLSSTASLSCLFFFGRGHGRFGQVQARRTLCGHYVCTVCASYYNIVEHPAQLRLGVIRKLFWFLKASLQSFPAACLEHSCPGHACARSVLSPFGRYGTYADMLECVHG